MLCNFHHFLENLHKKDSPDGNPNANNRKNIFEIEKIKPIYIPPYQYIPIYNKCVFKLDNAYLAGYPVNLASPVISQKLYNAIKYNSVFTKDEYKEHLPVKIRMYI